jgi:hypothetical protein
MFGAPCPVLYESGLVCGLYESCLVWFACVCVMLCGTKRRASIISNFESDGACKCSIPARRGDIW